MEVVAVPPRLNPNSDFRNLPFGPKPVLRKPSEHLFGVKPRHLRWNKFVPLKAETRPRLTRQIPKLPKATSESGLKPLRVLPLDSLPPVNRPRLRNENRVLSKKRGHGGGIVIVRGLGILLIEHVELSTYGRSAPQRSFATRPSLSVGRGSV